MRIFGLIGFPLSHSFSKKYFSEKFQKEGRQDCVYENFPIPSIDELTTLISRTPLLKGLNVTIPYKEQVIQFLDYKNEVVEETGACNCIKIMDHELHGFNTDTIGFKQSLIKKLSPSQKKALVLGTGGAAKAISYVLDSLKIEYQFVSRNKQSLATLKYEEVTDDILLSHTLIINTTPLGMYPNLDDAPPINYNILTPRHFLFDLVYNPEKTLFLKKGEEKGAAIENGHEMLIIQAEESWKIWNG